jgi:hypothetical protein
VAAFGQFLKKDKKRGDQQEGKTGAANELGCRVNSVSASVNATFIDSRAAFSAATLATYS